jgi:hypothetical protein
MATPGVDRPGRPGGDPGAGFKFCTGCGARLAFTAERCPHCGTPSRTPQGNVERSDRSYGVAIALCGVFGVMGVHHFYIGNHLHGILDLALFVGFVVLLVLGHPAAFALLLLDGAHTVYVFSMLILGKQRDGDGRVILPPGA